MIPRFLLPHLLLVVLSFTLLAACQPVQPEAPSTIAPTPIVAARTPTSVPPAGIPRPSAIDRSYVAGDWIGSLENFLGIRAKFQQIGNSWAGTAELPALATGRKIMGKIVVNPPVVQFQLDSGSPYAVSFNGLIGDDGVIRGTVLLQGQELTFELHRADSAKRAFLDGVTEEVHFLSGATKLEGTLSKPTGSGPFPAILLLGDTGPQNRDGEIFLPSGSAPLRRLAEALSQAGYLVLRLDDRGMGGSMGDYNHQYLDDMKRDVRSAIAFMLKREDVRPDSVGLVGYGEGATLSAVSKPEMPEIAYVAGIAAPASARMEFLRGFIRGEGDALMMEDEEIAAMLSLLDKAVESAELIPTQYTSAYLGQMLAHWNNAAQLYTNEVPYESRTRLLASLFGIDGFRSLHDLAFWSTDPVESWSAVDVPTLLVAGDLDLQASPSENQARIADALQAAGNANVTSVVIRGMNHLLLDAHTGSIAEYPRLSPELSEGLTAALIEWLDLTVAAIQE